MAKKREGVTVPADGDSPRKMMNRREFVHFLSVLSAGGSAFGNAALVLAQEGKKVTKEMLNQIEEMAGLKFTDAQRDLMIPTLENYLRNFQKIRDMSIPPEVAPAMYFLSDTRGTWTLQSKKGNG